jgi:hypothetical protein
LTLEKISHLGVFARETPVKKKGIEGVICFASFSLVIAGLPEAELQYYKCVTFFSVNLPSPVNTKKRPNMLTLTIAPVVLERLHEAFPKPKTSAAKALKKYKELLEHLLFKVMQRGRSNYETLLNCYSLPVADLTHKGPHIGPGKVRLHKWLNDNQLQLVQKVEEGSNITGLVSLVKLTDLVVIDDVTSEISLAVQSVKTPAELSQLLSSDAQKNQELFSALFPDYFGYLSSAQRDQVFDHVPIDVPSLEAYVAWLNTKATKMSPGRVRVYTEQALLILAIAKHTGGFYPQRRKPSPFGRTYYCGISVQNVNKELRRAMLGNCWEYDIRSSVVTWKMTFAQELTDQKYPLKECRKLFWASWLYLEDRRDFMLEVRKEVFGITNGLPVQYQEKLIKEAITAISFGARSNVNGWRETNGVWINSALGDILKNSSQRTAFLNNATVQAFIKEQALLDTYIADGLKTEMPDVYFGPLITRNIKPSKSKAVAFAYQKSETRVMNVAYEVLAKHRIKPIARIHDAFVVRHKLSIDLRSEIIEEMKDQTLNNHWKIIPKHLDRYNFNLSGVMS